MKRLGLKWMLPLFALAMVIMSCASSVFVNEAIPRMDKDTLLARLDRPDTVVLDVRIGRHWSGSDRMIRGAEKAEANPKAVNRLADRYPKNATIVLYCA